MKPKENQGSRQRMTPSPSKQCQTQYLFNPQYNHTDSGKRRLSPSNYSENPHLKTAVKRKDPIQQNIFHTVQIENINNKEQLNIRQKVEALENLNRALTEGIQELRKQNMELMENNGALKNEIFQREDDRTSIRKLEEQIFRLEREMDGLEIEVKEKNSFINIQMVAKQHNAQIMEDMNFEIREMHHLYDSEKDKVNLLNIKIKKFQDEAAKMKKKIRQFELGQKSLKESSQSMKANDRQNQNLRQKIKVLEGINERQKQQITDLLSALPPREFAHSTTSSDLKIELNNEPFDPQYSEILHRCVTENDGEDLRPKIVELEGIIAELRNQNRQYKEKIGLTRVKNSSRDLNDLIAEKQQYEVELQKQHSKIIDMNEQIFQMNHENHLLAQQKQHYYRMSKEMELTGLKLTEQLAILFEQKIKTTEHVKYLTEQVRKYHLLKEDYEMLEQQHRCIRQEAQQNQLFIEELNRKNKQLLLYVEQLRSSQQALNQQLIEKSIEIDELRVIQIVPKVEHKQPIIHKDQSKIEKLLRQRNIKVMSGLNKFKQIVTNQVKMMELQLLVAQNTYTTQQSQDVIIKLKRRLKTILQNN